MTQRKILPPCNQEASNYLLVTKFGSKKAPNRDAHNFASCGVEEHTRLVVPIVYHWQGFFLPSLANLSCLPSPLLTTTF